MKRIILAVILTLAISLFTGMAFAQCTTIQDGTLLRSDGVLIQTGFDEWGYNYQAHMLNRKYCDAYRNAPWCQSWKDDDLMMKWNDAWLSNQDCDEDSLLDRHYGFPSYIGSGAWLTNHQRGVYYDAKGKKQRWEYFVKIVAAPTDATKSGDFWYAPGNIPIGAVIGGILQLFRRFIMIQEQVTMAFYI